VLSELFLAQRAREARARRGARQDDAGTSAADLLLWHPRADVSRADILQDAAIYHLVPARHCRVCAYVFKP
jgi:hypothetical protein